LAAVSRGFTLIELVVVIVILGVLAAIALPRFIDLTGDAERASIQSFTGALAAAQSLAFTKMTVAGVGYANPSDLSLNQIVRCDSNPQIGPNGNAWGGHYIALAGLRSSVFSDPVQNACSGNTISFNTKSGRSVTITNSASGIAWSATPAY